MGVLLDLEDLVLRLEHDRQVDVERGGIGRKGVVVGVLDVAAGILAVLGRVYIILDELRVEILQKEETTLSVDHWLRLARLVYHEERGDACGLCHAVIVGAERGGYVRYPYRPTGDVVAQNHAEGVTVLGKGLHPRYELTVTHALQLGAEPRLVLHFERAFHLLGEVCADEGLGHDYMLRLVGIGVAALDAHVFDRGAYGQRRIRRQRPRCGGPCKEVELAVHALEELLALGVAHDLELRRAGSILHVAVAARLVQLCVDRPVPAAGE